jgi:hypothetical protein
MQSMEPIYFAPQPKIGGGWICFKDSPSPPPAPDYTGAAQATAEGNLQNAKQAQQANMVNQYTPYGNLTYTQAGNWADGNPQYQSNISLSPTGQALLDANNKSQLGLAALQQGAGQNVSNVMGKPFQYTGPAVQTSIDNPQVNTRLNTNGVPALPTADGNTLRQAQDAAYNQATSRLDPQWKTAEQQKDTQLRNQGLTPGTEAYDNAMRDFNFAKNDAYSQARNSAVSQGLAAEQAQFGMGLQANQTGFNQALNQGQFANTAAGQNFSQGLQSGQFQNTAAQNALAQQAQLYNMPLNQLTALMSGSQVTNPQFGQSPQQQTVAGPNYLGAAQATGQYNQGLYNSQVASDNAMTSGLFSLGAAALGAPTGTFQFSDVRLKSNIKRIDTHPNGFGIYEYDIDGHREIGVIAQEVLIYKPEAVAVHPSGYFVVDYGQLH